jgi:hypothetical protein
MLPDEYSIRHHAAVAYDASVRALSASRQAHFATHHARSGPAARPQEPPEALAETNEALKRASAGQ